MPTDRGEHLNSAQSRPRALGPMQRICFEHHAETVFGEDSASAEYRQVSGSGEFECWVGSERRAYAALRSDGGVESEA